MFKCEECKKEFEGKAQHDYDDVAEGDINYGGDLCERCFHLSYIVTKEVDAEMDDPRDYIQFHIWERYKDLSAEELKKIYEEITHDEEA